MNRTRYDNDSVLRKYALQCNRAMFHPDFFNQRADELENELMDNDVKKVTLKTIELNRRIAEYFDPTSNSLFK